MLPDSRSFRSLVSAIPARLASPYHLNRASSPLLSIALVLSILLAGLTALRMSRVDNEYQPALGTARELGATLEALNVQLRDGRMGALDLRLARADSLANRFHVIAQRAAGAEPRVQLLAHDEVFAEFFVAAHRAAAGLSMSADADGSSAEDAALGYHMLRENLRADIQAQEQAIDGARPATAPIELAGWLALTMFSSAALLRRSTRSTQDAPAKAMDRNASEDCSIPVSTGDGPAAIRLQDAVERMARKRLAASIAAARVAKRNNERQIELAQTWHAPMLSIVPASQPTVEMDVYSDDQADESGLYGRLALVSR